MTAQTVSQAVEKREAGPVSVMFASKRQFAAVLPKSVDVEAFLGTMAGALYSNPELNAAARANPDSLYTALMRCAALGHMPGTDEFYLTPRKVKGRPSVLGIEGYRGVIERMYRSGAVKKVVVREVCALDGFSYTEGEMDKPVHSFGGSGATGADFFGASGSRSRGEMVGAYAYAELTTGAISRVVILTRADWEAARAAGGWKPDDDYSPWNRLDAGKDHPEFRGRSMVWKTAAKRLEPWVPTSAEYRREMLRASASAADLAATRSRAEPAQANGHTVPPEPVYDAEIVGDPHDAPAEPRRRPPADVPATSKALEKLNGLLASLPLGPEETRRGDERAILSWLAGGDWTATTAQVRLVTSQVESFIASAGGDLGDAATAIWVRYHDQNPQVPGE